MQEKEVTIYDLSKILNVSAATVSRALKGHPSISEKTKKKINDLAGKLGYQPNQFASKLRRQRTNTIGVIVHELSSHFITSVLNGIEQIATNSDYDMIICHSAESAAREITNVANLFSKRVDGLIASLAYDTESLSHFDSFINKGIPIVFFDRVEPKSPGIKIVIDNTKVGYDAAVHLIHQGCKKIMHVTGCLKRNVYADRWKGFQNALSELGLPCGEDQLIVNDLSEKASIDAAKQILKRKELPDGLFIANDLCATICMQIFKEAGLRIPDDIAIVGFNNDIVSRIVDPKLTTINYSGREMGEFAAKCLIEQINNHSTGNKNYTIVLHSELIIRASSQKLINMIRTE